ncbi:hypothetical protein B296_00008043 [Ensete ventricosum]|uniref:Uncharacterized protein n=1 Tax=Ensete ventricosum TaxID=4639 RepID=A0A427B4A0_ENSVE|nr:hypothetical protein B296_00008043 [Ensete ventricosum]
MQCHSRPRRPRGVATATVSSKEVMQCHRGLLLLRCNCCQLVHGWRRRACAVPLRSRPLKRKRVAVAISTSAGSGAVLIVGACRRPTTFAPTPIPPRFAGLLSPASGGMEERRGRLISDRRRRKRYLRDTVGMAAVDVGEERGLSDTRRRAIAAIKNAGVGIKSQVYIVAAGGVRRGGGETV